MTLGLMQPLSSHVCATSGHSVEDSTLMEAWQGLSTVAVDQIADNWAVATERYAKGRQEHCLSAEFLMGRVLPSNLPNPGLIEQAREALTAYDLDLGQVLEEESDAVLGNGGLGRSVVCFLDSCATLDLLMRGYGIPYRYGLSKQLFDNGLQTEHPDPWMEERYPFVVRREERARIVPYADLTVRAILYDIMITGYGTKNVGILHLWKAEPIEGSNCDAFNSQRFTDAIVDRECIIDISRILYPNDTMLEGKILRVRQQYFFRSASLQEVVANYARYHGTGLDGFAEFDAIQLSDAHPVLAIPELMRILMDEHGLGWEEAQKVVSKTFAYMGHTVLAEALETWDIHTFDRLFSCIAEIVRKIDHHFRIDMAERSLDQAMIDYMAPVAGNAVRMARIACYGSHSINGATALHAEIIKRDVLKEWYAIWPERFNNKTNGATPYRRLKQCSPRLAVLLDEVTSSDAWVRDLMEFSKFTGTSTDEVLERLGEIKHANKVDFATQVKEREGVEIDPDVIFDVQVKRLHEYKRRLFSAFYILDLYFHMKDDPTLDIPNRVFILGTKAASGYIRVKATIKLVNAVAELMNNDADINGRIKVVFVHNCNISSAKHITPATDVSERVSTVSKKASGTPNMKFMIDGVLILGTLDGVNVEILETMGDENAYIFGATDGELPELRHHYDPRQYHENVPGLKCVIDAPTDGTLDDSSSGWFHDACHSILGGSYDLADAYYVLGNFASYRGTEDRMAADYRDQKAWNARIWTSISRSDRFSPDRMISDYACKMWHIESEPIA